MRKLTLALALLALLAGAAVATAQDDPTSQPSSQPAPTDTKEAPADKKETPAPKKVETLKFKKTPSGLQFADISKGKGAVALMGTQVTVHYTGWLEDGTKFDSSLDRGQPFVFPLGVGRVIKGWDEGVAGMRVGGRRKLIIPSELGYGDRGAGGLIPGGATLIFEVELLKVQNVEEIE